MLALVKPAEIDNAQAVTERIKAAPNPDGAWQCNRCGGRTSLTTENGAKTVGGIKQKGTIINKDVCAQCWRAGIDSPMRPRLFRVA